MMIKLTLDHENFSLCSFGEHIYIPTGNIDSFTQNIKTEYAPYQYIISSGIFGDKYEKGYNEIKTPIGSIVYTKSRNYYVTETPEQIAELLFEATRNDTN